MLGRWGNSPLHHQHNPPPQHFAQHCRLQPLFLSFLAPQKCCPGRSCHFEPDRGSKGMRRVSRGRSSLASYRELGVPTYPSDRDSYLHKGPAAAPAPARSTVASARAQGCHRSKESEEGMRHSRSKPRIANGDNTQGKDQGQRRATAIAILGVFGEP